MTRRAKIAGERRRTAGRTTLGTDLQALLARYGVGGYPQALRIDSPRDRVAYVELFLPLDEQPVQP